MDKSRCGSERVARGGFVVVGQSCILIVLVVAGSYVCDRMASTHTNEGVYNW